MMKWIMIVLVVAGLAISTPVSAGGPAESKDLIDANGRVWPGGVPHHKKKKQYHPDAMKHKPLHKKKPLKKP